MLNYINNVIKYSFGQMRRETTTEDYVQTMSGIYSVKGSLLK